MKERRPFTEKPPSIDDPKWADKFCDWLTRKAAHYNCGPVELMAEVLGCSKKDKKRARLMDEKSRRVAPGMPRPNGGFESPSENKVKEGVQ